MGSPPASCAGLYGRDSGVPDNPDNLYINAVIVCDRERSEPIYIPHHVHRCDCAGLADSGRN
ncbi:hypothetical protein EXIGLDRAFT_730788, partial [Exidia glandulosa HHB12029]